MLCNDNIILPNMIMYDYVQIIILCYNYKLIIYRTFGKILIKFHSSNTVLDITQLILMMGPATRQMI